MKSRGKQNRIFAGLIALGVLVWVGNMAPAVHAQSRASRQLVSRAENISGDRFTVQATTPRGVRVISVARPRADMLRAIDDGFTALFTAAQRNGYRNRLNYGAYTVFIARPDRSKSASGEYSPDLAVAAGQYAGSGYDQGGYIYAAGMVLAYDPSAFIIAEHDGNLQRVKDIVRYEGEHIILYFNNRALYQQTADHSQGGGHPILH
jgi:hypothetical protein